MDIATVIFGSLDLIFAGMLITWYLRIRRLHYRSPTGSCAECHNDYPCPTVKIMIGGF